MTAITYTSRDRGEDERHGTVTGAARHAAVNEAPCDACRAAKAEYDKRWRSAPERTRLSRLHAKAQAQALRDLKRAHEDEYRENYLRHKAELMREHMRHHDGSNA